MTLDSNASLDSEDSFGTAGALSPAGSSVNGEDLQVGREKEPATGPMREEEADPEEKEIVQAQHEQEVQEQNGVEVRLQKEQETRESQQEASLQPPSDIINKEKAGQEQAMAKVEGLEGKLVLLEEEKAGVVARAQVAEVKLQTVLMEKCRVEKELEAKNGEASGLEKQVVAFAQQLRESREREAAVGEKLAEAEAELAKNGEAIKAVSLAHEAGVLALVLVEENCARLQQEMDRVQKENKQIAETLIKMKQKEQDLMLAGQRDAGTIREPGLTCDKRGAEEARMDTRVQELMVKEVEGAAVENRDKMGHKLEFFTSQVEEYEAENQDTSLSEMTEKLEVLTELEAQVGSLQQELAASEMKPNDPEQSVEGMSEDVPKAKADQKERRQEAEAELGKDEVEKSDRLAKEARKWSLEGNKLVMRADVVEKELAKENDCAATEEAEEEEDDEEEPEKVYSSANMDEGAAGRQSL